MAAATLNKGKYLSDIVLNYYKGTQPAAPPATFYVALFTTMPTKNDGTSAVEVSTSGTGYARLAITNGQFGAISTNADNLTEQASSSIDLTWTNTGGGTNYGTVLGVGIYDALTVGNLWAFGQLADGSGNATSYSIVAGNTFKIPSGSLTLKEK